MIRERDERRPNRRDDRVSAILQKVRTERTAASWPYELTSDFPEVRVRDVRTGSLVAYSGTRADHADSLEEFVSDFIVR